MSFNFGDKVVFNKEFRSTKPKTIDLHSLYTDTLKEFEALGIEGCGELIECKAEHVLKATKTGVFLGTIKINLAFYYDYYETDYDSGYRAGKGGFIDVAEVRCAGIKKTYYVPLDNLKRSRNS